MSNNRLATDDDEIIVLGLQKANGERYAFIYDEAGRGECLRMLGRYAADPDLSFSWHDAAALSQRIRLKP